MAEHVPALFSVEATVRKVQGEINKVTAENKDKLFAKTLAVVGLASSLLRGADGAPLFLTPLARFFAQREFASNGDLLGELCA